MNQRDGKVHLSWSRVSNANQYRIRVFNNSSVVYYEETSGDEQKSMISLAPCVQYLIELCAVNDTLGYSEPVVEIFTPFAPSK